MAASWLLLMMVAGLGGFVVWALSRTRSWGAPAVGLAVVGLTLLALVVVRAQSLRRTQVNFVPASNMHMYTDDGSSVTFASQTVRSARIGMIVFPLAIFAAILAIVFAIVRHRHGHGGPRIATAALGSLALLGMVGWFTARHEVHTATPATEWSTNTYPPPISSPVPGSFPQPLAVEGPAAEPIDELWLRLNQPRIQLQEDAPQAPEGVASESPPTDEGGVVAEVAESDAAAEAPAEDVAQAPAETSEAFEEAAADHRRAEDNREIHVEEEAAANAASAWAAHENLPKPDWIVNPPKLVGEVRRVVVQAGPYGTLPECHDKLQEEMSKVVLRRIEELVQVAHGQRYAYVPPWLGEMRLGHDYITRELLSDDYVETGLASYGETYTAWGLLEFNAEQDKRLLEAWEGYARRDGIGITIGLSALVLSVLGLVYGLIKVDTWTRGYYTKRLFLGVPAAIIAVFLLLAAANG
jgi:hypothetical protein